MNDPRILHVDLHTHTYHSPDSLISPRRLVEACREKGIDCVAVTDHNSIQGALAVRELADFPVIIGEEIRSAAGEIIALFLNEEVPRGLSAEETIERVKSQGGLVGVPHPYDRLRSALRREEMERLAGRLDFIEALNARIVLPDNNGRALRFARDHGLAISAGSDAHSPGELGGAYVEMREFDGPPDFLEALRAGSLIGKLSSPLVHLWTRYAVLRRKLGWRPV